MKVIDASRLRARSLKHPYMLSAAVSGGLLIAASLVLGGQKPAPPVSQASDDGIDRYLTYVSTDKPIYRIGEKVYVRGVVLRATGHYPMPATTGGFLARIEIKGPKGDTVTSGSARTIDSTVVFSWDIPGTQPGGEYTVRIFHPSMGTIPAERKFDIRAYRAPRLKSQIVFLRDGYGPGDTVTANLHVDRAEGGIPAGAKVSVSARVDGVEVWQGGTIVDGVGNAGASFKLPAEIARGEGAIAMTIEDGGTVETATKTIPILLQTLDLGIYPEGGDLVAGLQTRVYLEGKTPAQKSADMAGVIVNAAGKQVAAFRTEHEGRGRFSFTPAKGEAYSLRLTEPAGIKTIFPLPAVKEKGSVISSTSDVTSRQQDVVVRVASTEAGLYGVGLTQGGKKISSTFVKLKAGEPANITLTVPKSVDGALVATVYDDRKTPVAERLIFRQPDRRLHVKVVPDRTDYVPGDKVTLKIASTDDKGKPAGAVVGLTVTDSSVLEMIDKREQAPRLPVMVLLENDVRNLSDAHVYLDETNPKAAIATDLLLGTQGWRRFATVDPAKWITENGGANRRSPVMASLTVSEREKAMSMLLPIGMGSTTTLNPDMISEIRLILAPVDAEAGRGNGQVRIDTVNAGITLDEAQLMGLPLVGNDPLALIATLPGYRANPLGHEFDTVGGLPMYMINTVRDGLSVTDWRIDCGGTPFRNEPIIGGIVVGGGFGNGNFGGGGGCVPANGNAAAFNKDTDPRMIREYAHQRGPSWTEGVRADFAETVYWNGGVKTNASTGVATVSFFLSDSVTSFRVLADGFAPDGTLGSSVGEVESTRPFFVEPRLPQEVTSGDVIQLPIGVVNGTSRELRGVEITPAPIAGLTFTMPGDNVTILRAKERARRLVQIDVAPNFSGIAKLSVDAAGGPHRDTVNRSLKVQPLGFPYEKSSGGILESNGSTSFEFTLPAETLPGSISSNVVVYPTPLASLTEALQALIREPFGCFEQTSSTSYPMVMAQQYFLTHTGVDPGIIERTKTLLETSYKKLIGFQSRSRGYEWFGGDPGHEALTAYGLMQFTDMSRVSHVDQEMLQNTRAWLLSRRDGSGAFKRNSRAIDSFGGAPAETTNAYITWALVESGEKGLEQEIALVKASANSTEDSYIIALAANLLHVTGDHEGARQLMNKLARTQESAGNVKGAVTSITRSGGEALTIETTALAVLAWMHEPSYASNVELGMKWIGEVNKNGRFGSTQSTILALRSIVAYDSAHAHAKAPGRLLLTVDGKVVSAPIAFTPDTNGALVMPEFASSLGAGKHTVGLRMEDGSPMPFSMNVKYNSTLPNSSEQTRIGIQVALKDTQVREGGITEATVSIVNKSDEVIPTPVAIVGIPGGLEVRHDQLKELVKSGRIDAYEVTGREVVLYWRFLKAGDRFEFPLSLVAATPGSYTGPASRAYLYYTDEYKNWAPGLKVNITPR